MTIAYLILAVINILAGVCLHGRSSLALGCLVALTIPFTTPALTSWEHYGPLGGVVFSTVTFAILAYRNATAPERLARVSGHPVQ